LYKKAEFNFSREVESFDMQTLKDLGDENEDRKLFE
jgi:hypothetical protein